MKKKTNVVAIVTMFFLFAMVAFVTNMAAPFGNIWGYQYSWAGMMGNMMNFAAYLFMGIPAGRMLATVGYKKTSLTALGVGFVGLLVQYVSSRVGADVPVFTVQGQVVALNLIIYLLGAFISGFCVCMLNTVVNPMLNTLGGGGNKGNQLVQTGGSLNSLTATLTPFLVGVLVGTVDESTSMNDVTPLLFIGMGVFVLAFIIISRVNVPEPALERARAEVASGQPRTKDKYSAWSFRHFVLGAVAIFFYVGIEVGIPGELNFYLSQPVEKGGIGFEGSAAIAGTLVSFYWLLMLVGRVLSGVISGKVSTRAQMISVSSLAIVLLLVAIFLPDSATMEVKGGAVPVKCLFIVLCGICTSVMWGAIFNLCVEGLGKYTEQASGIFMMLVVGGGIMPMLQNNVVVPAVGGYIQSYWLIVAMLVYLLYYSVWGCKNVNKNIPV
ncbi:MAG TPA: MFS transporter [Candidatus Cryptobacteroides merdipullorum]|uniref:MFS transporter n=1 Tax=Candidatus Cryptobacteroides merdipullorum TaxID=2840771 RepID=A0A9D1KI29_9BACT|nr:MFS transporter [Candidatus Cryptobacteroides merdipullorum]